ncbi:hypothetical protein FNF27_02424 [Cafeteria roenbergensis]|uniref:HECT domain-containing protein n=3 Tax=Cafeteria roenbergensis TaxID=33653 RepID=A0A5A8EES6_CAFRO|nr:hypothetical protein FNF27_02424 [Cafeteria roenbergensis]
MASAAAAPGGSASAFAERAAQDPGLVAAVCDNFDNDSFLRAVLPKSIVAAAKTTSDIGLTQDAVDRLAARSSDFERLLGAGIRESEEAKPQTLMRLIERLAVEMGPVSDAAEWVALRRAASSAVAPAVDHARKGAALPFVPMRTKPASPTDEPQQVQELVLMTLASIVRTCPVDDLEEARPPLEDLAAMVAEYRPGELYDDWSPPRAPPVIPIPLDDAPGSLAEGVLVHASKGADSAPNALFAGKEGWETSKITFGGSSTFLDASAGDAVFTVRLPEVATLSSVTIDWKSAPGTFSVQVYTGPAVEFAAAEAAAIAAVNADNEARARTGEASASSAPACDSPEATTARFTGQPSRWVTYAEDIEAKPGSMTLPLGSARACAVRLVLRGKHESNEDSTYNMASLVLARPNSAALHTPALSVVGDIQTWLLRTAAAAAKAAYGPTGSAEAEEVGGIALAASASLVGASAALPAVLRHVMALLSLPDPTAEAAGPAAAASGAAASSGDSAVGSNWCYGAPAAAMSANEALLLEVIKGRKGAKERLALLSGAGGGDSTPSAATVKPRFDLSLTEVSSSDLTLSDGETSVRTSTGSNRVALVAHPVSKGKVVVRFLNKEDHGGGECSAYGFCPRPVTSTSYSDIGYMYRCYNGQLYGPGSVDGSKERVHQGDIIEITLDCEAHTISYKINDKDQGVCFRDVDVSGSRQLYPAVQFYSSNVAATCQQITVIPSAAELREAAKRKAAEAALAASKKGAAAELSPEEELAALIGGAVDAIDDAAAGPPPPGDAPVPPPGLPAKHDKEAVEARLPEGVLATLMGMTGAPFYVVAAAFDAAGGNADAAAGSLFDGGVDVAEQDEEHRRVVAEHERAVVEYQQKLNAYETAKAAYEAFKEERVRKIRQAASDASEQQTDSRPRMRDAVAILAAVDSLATVFCPADATSVAAARPGASGEASELARPASASRSSIPQVRAAKDAIDLEEPFCLLARGETFVLLAGLIRGVLPLVRGKRVVDPTPPLDAPASEQVAGAAMQVCIRALHLLRANLERLEQAHVDPADADIHVGGDSPTLAPVRALLADLMAPNGDASSSAGPAAASGAGGGLSSWPEGAFPSALQHAAVEVTEAGLGLLYGSAEERAALLSDLLHRHSAGQLSQLQEELLARCLNRFATPAGAASLLPPSLAAIFLSVRAFREREGIVLASQEAEDAAMVEAVRAEAQRAAKDPQTAGLLTSLFELVCSASARDIAAAAAVGSGAVDDAGAGGSCGLEVLSKALQLLSQFQRLLLSLVREELASAQDEADRVAAASAAKTLRSRGTFASGILADEEPATDAQGNAADEALVGPGWVPTSMLAQAPGCRLLVSYTHQLCGAARLVLRAAEGVSEALAVHATETVSGGFSRRQATAVALTSAVRRSVLSRLVAPFVSALEPLERQPWFVADVLPHLVVLVRDVDGLAAKLVPASASAARALASAHGVQFSAPPAGRGWEEPWVSPLGTDGSPHGALSGAASGSSAAAEGKAFASAVAAADASLGESKTDDAEEPPARQSRAASVASGGGSSSVSSDAGPGGIFGDYRASSVGSAADDADDDDDDAEIGMPDDEEAAWRPPEGQVLFKGFAAVGHDRPDLWLRLRFKKDPASAEAAAKRAAELAEALDKSKSKQKAAANAKAAAATDPFNGALFRVSGFGVCRAGPRRFSATGCATASGRMAVWLRFLPLPVDAVTGQRPPAPVLLVTGESAASTFVLSGQSIGGAIAAAGPWGGVAVADSALPPFPAQAALGSASAAAGGSGFELRRCDDAGELLEVPTSEAATGAGSPEAELLQKLKPSTAPASGARSADAARKAAAEEAAKEAKAARLAAMSATRAALGPSGRAPRHAVLAVQRLVTATAASMAAAIARGPRICFEEAALQPLFGSPVFAGGLPLAIVTGAGAPPPEGEVEAAGAAEPGASMPVLRPANSQAKAVKGSPAGLPLAWDAAFAAADAGKPQTPAQQLLALRDEAALADSVLDEDAWALGVCDFDGKDRTAPANRLLSWVMLAAADGSSGSGKKGATFPRVMVPAFLAAAKHAGGSILANLRNEVLPAVIAAFDSGKSAEDVAAEVECPAPLAEVWAEVKHLLSFLRAEQRAFKAKTAGDAGAKSGGGEEGVDSEGEAGAAAVASGRVAERRMRPKQPSSMKSLNVSTRSLALFLLAMRPARPSSGSSPDGGAADDAAAPSSLAAPASARLLRRASSTRGAASGLSQMQARWASALPQPALRPLMQRWSSTGAGSDEEGSPKAGSSGGASSFVTMGLVARLTRVRSRRAAAAAAAGAAGSDSEGDDLLYTKRSPAQAAALLVIQALRTSFATPVPMLRRLLFWRLQRARARSFGLSALAELLSSATLPGPQADVLAAVRGGLVCETELKETAMRMRRRTAADAARRQVQIERDILTGAGTIGELVSNAARDETMAAEHGSESELDSDDSDTAGHVASRQRRLLRRRVVETLREGGSLGDVAAVLSGDVAGASGSASDGEADGAAEQWRTRHHYLAGLEGVPSALLNDVQLAHIRLLTRAGDMLGEAAAVGDTARALRACWAWATDLEPRDHEFLLRVGLLPALRRVYQGRGDLALASLSGHAEAVEDAPGALASEVGLAAVSAASAEGSGVAPDASAGPPRMLRFESSIGAKEAAAARAAAVLRATSLAGDGDPDSPLPSSGSHMQEAPDSWVTKGTSSFADHAEEAHYAGANDAWLRRRRLDGEPALTAAVTPTAELLTAYAAFGPETARATDAYFGTDASVASDESLAKRRSEREGSASKSGGSGPSDEVLASTASERRLKLAGPGSAGLASSALNRSVRPARMLDTAADPVCFAEHSGHGEGRVKVSRPALVHGPLSGKEAVFCDKAEGFAMESLPSSWADCERRNHIHLVRGCHATAKLGKKARLTLRLTVPSRVFVFVPNGLSTLPDWLSARFERAKAVTFPLKTPSSSKRVFECFASKVLFVPEADATATSGYAEVVLGGAQINRTANSSSSEPDKLPFVVFVESFPRACLTDLIRISEAPAEADTGILERVDPPRAPEGLLRRATGTLFRLLCATGVGGTAGLRLREGDSGEGSSESKGADAARVDISHGVGRVPASQTWRYSLQLQQVAFSLQREVLELSAAAMASGAAAATSLCAAASTEDATSDPGAATVDTIEAESSAVAQLNFLSSVADTRAAKLYLTTPPFLATMLSCLRFGSPRVRQSVLAILGALGESLPVRPLEVVMSRVFAPEDCARWSALAEGSVVGEGFVFAGMLLELCSASACAALGLPPPREMGQPEGEDAAGAAVRAAAASGSLAPDSDAARAVAGDCLWAASGFGSGDARLAVACDAVTLLRTLVRSDASPWHKPLVDVITAAVTGAAGLDAHSVGFPGGFNNAARVLGSLAVLGGHVEVARRGGKALVGRDGLAARIVEMPFGSQQVRVVFSDDVTASPQPCDPRQLAPVPVVDAPVRAFAPAARELLAAMESIMEVCNRVASTGATGGAAFFWASRLRASVVGALAQTLQSRRAVRTALGQASLTDALFSLALQPISRRGGANGGCEATAGFVTALGLRNRLTVVESRLAEARTLELVADASAKDELSALALKAIGSPESLATADTAGATAAAEAGFARAAAAASDALPGGLDPAAAAELAHATKLPISVALQAWALLSGRVRTSSDAEERKEADAADEGKEAERFVPAVPSYDEVRDLGRIILMQWPQRLPMGSFQGEWQLSSEDAADVLASASGPPGSGEAARSLVRAKSAAADAPEDASAGSGAAFDLASLLPESAPLGCVATAATIKVVLQPAAQLSSTAGAVTKDTSALPKTPEDALAVTKDSAAIVGKVIYSPRRLAWDPSSAESDSVWVADVVASMVAPPRGKSASRMFLRVLEWHCSGGLHWPPAWTSGAGEKGWAGDRCGDSKEKDAESDDSDASDSDGDGGEKGGVAAPAPVEGEHFLLEITDAAAGEARISHSRWSRRARRGAMEVSATEAIEPVPVHLQATETTLPPRPSDSDLLRLVAGPAGSKKKAKSAASLMSDDGGSGVAPVEEARNRLGLATAWNTGAPAYSLKPLVVGGGASGVGKVVVPDGWTAEEVEWARSGWAGVRRAEWDVITSSSSLWSFGMVMPERAAKDSDYVGSDTRSWGMLNDGRRGHDGGWRPILPGRSSGDYIPDKTRIIVTHYPDGRITVQLSCHAGEEFELGRHDKPLFPAVALGNSGQKVRLVRTVPPMAFDESKCPPVTSDSSSTTLAERPIASSLTVKDGVVSVPGGFVSGANASPTLRLPVHFETLDDSAPPVKLSETLQAFEPMAKAGASPAWIGECLSRAGCSDKEKDKFFRATTAPIPGPAREPATLEELHAKADAAGVAFDPAAAAASAVPLVVGSGATAAAAAAAAATADGVTLRGKAYPASGVVALRPPALAPMSASMAAAADIDTSGVGGAVAAMLTGMAPEPPAPTSNNSSPAAEAAASGGAIERSKIIAAAKARAAAGFAVAPGARTSSTIALDQRFALFSAVVTLADDGLADSASSSRSGKAKGASSRLARPVVFEAIADGRVVWRSRPLCDPRESDTCSVPVFSTSALRLSVRAASANEVLDSETRIMGSLAAASHGKDATAPWEGIAPPPATDGLPVEAATAVWLFPQLSGAGAATLPPGAALAVIEPEEAAGCKAPSLEDELAELSKAKASGSKSGSSSSDSMHRRITGRHHPFGNSASGLRALPIVTYAPLAAAGGQTAAAASAAGAGNEEAADAAADAPVQPIPAPSLRVLVLDPDTGLRLPRHVPVSMLAAVETIYGSQLSNPSALRRDAAWSCDALASLEARAALRFVVVGAAAAASDWLEERSGGAAKASSASSAAGDKQDDLSAPPATANGPALLSALSSAGEALDPSTCLEAAGGARRIVALLRLAAANDEEFRQAAKASDGGGEDDDEEEAEEDDATALVATAAVAQGPDGAPAGAVRALRAGIRALVNAEREVSLSSVPVASAAAAAGSLAAAPLLSELVRQTTGTFSACSTVPPAQLVESLHPHPVGVEHCGTVGHPSRGAIAITMDPRTGLLEGATLEFFASSRMADADRILAVTGRAQAGEDAASTEGRSRADLARLVDAFEATLPLPPAGGSDEKDAPATVTVSPAHEHLVSVPGADGAESAAGKPAWRVRISAPAGQVWWRFRCPTVGDAPADATAAGGTPTKLEPATGTSSVASASVASTAAPKAWGFRFAAQVQVAEWQSEAHVEAPSLAFATWLLGFLLSAGLKVPRGALHSQAMVDALQLCLRRRGGVFGPTQHRIVSLLSRLVAAPGMFVRIPDLGALDNIERRVLAKAATKVSAALAAAKRSGRRSRSGDSSQNAIPSPMLRMMELFVARRAAQEAFEEAERARQEALEKRGSGVALAFSAPGLTGDDFATGGIFGSSSNNGGPSGSVLSTVGIKAPSSLDESEYSALKDTFRALPGIDSSTDLDGLDTFWSAEIMGSSEKTACSHPSITLRELLDAERDPEAVAMAATAMLIARGGDPLAGGKPMTDLDAAVDVHDMLWLAAMGTSDESLMRRVTDCVRPLTSLLGDSSDADRDAVRSSGTVLGMPLGDFDCIRGVCDVCTVRKPWHDAVSSAARPAATAVSESDGAEGCGKSIGELAIIRVVRPAGMAAVHEARVLHMPSKDRAAETKARLAPTAAIDRLPKGTSAVAMLDDAEAASGEAIAAAIKAAVAAGAVAALVPASTAMPVPEPPVAATAAADEDEDNNDAPPAAAAAAADADATAAKAAAFELAKATSAAAGLASVSVPVFVLSEAVAATLRRAIASDAELSATASVADDEDADGAPTEAAAAAAAPAPAGGAGAAEAAASSAAGGASPLAGSFASSAMAARLMGRVTTRRAMRQAASRAMGGSVDSSAVAGADSVSAFRDLVASGGFGAGAARVKAELPKEPKTLMARMLVVNALADTLLRGTRPPDALFAAVWLRAVGMRPVRETSHPFDPKASLRGSVTILGASTVGVTLHPRCSLPAGCALVLTDARGVVTRCEGVGPSATPSGSSSHADACKRWPTKMPSMAGPTISYDIEVPEGMTEVDAHAWGVAFTLNGEKSLSGSRQKALVAAHEHELGFALRGITQGWTPTKDSDLCRLARQACQRVNSGDSGSKGKSKKSSSVTPTTMDLADLCVATPSEALRFQALDSMPVLHLRMRLELLRAFNAALAPCLPAFALNASRPWTTGYKLRALSHCIFLDVKRDVLKSWLSATEVHSTSMPTLRLNNFKETAAEASGDTSLENGGIFVQAFECFRSVSPSGFRGLVDESNKKVFEVKFEGEEGIDAGGVYREGLTRIVESAFSPHLSLLVATPNNLRSEGEGSNAFVPNSAHDTPRATEMMQFLGRFMGLSLRHESCLPFEFPSIVWRRLLGQAPTFSDFAGLDVAAAAAVSSIRHCDRSISPDGHVQAAITSDEDFAAAFPGLRFTTTLTSGKTVDLIPDGASTAVTFSNRVKWCDLVERTRLREFDRHIASMRVGLGQVVPLRALALFTFDELESLVCGSAIIDIAVLKKHTDYSGYSASSETVKLFWKVFESLTDEERSQYVRFSWGRSRLPADGQTWTHRHSLNRTGGGSRRALPNAHTCFFTTDLPDYTTEEDMRWGLLTAIHYGGGLLQG